MFETKLKLTIGYDWEFTSPPERMTKNGVLPKASEYSIDQINDFMFKKIASVIDSELRC